MCQLFDRKGEFLGNCDCGTTSRNNNVQQSQSHSQQTTQQSNPQVKKTISAGAWDNYSHARGNSLRGEAVFFDKEGKIHWAKTTTQTYIDEERFGTYYIDERNTVHITWNNGYEEKGTISYDTQGKIIFTYKGKTFKQSYGF